MYLNNTVHSTVFSVVGLIQTPETCPAFSCPSFSCPSISCPSFSAPPESGKPTEIRRRWRRTVRDRSAADWADCDHQQAAGCHHTVHTHRPTEARSSHAAHDCSVATSLPAQSAEVRAHRAVLPSTTKADLLPSYSQQWSSPASAVKQPSLS